VFKEKERAIAPFSYAEASAATDGGGMLQGASHDRDLIL
jgi:hypothetical protein